MRVMVDARQIFRPERRGIGKTMLQLYRTLSAIRPAWQFHLIHQLSFAVPEFADCPNLIPVRIDFPGSHRSNLWENLVLPHLAWWRGGDVLHSPANTGPSSSRIPLVLHLHDLIPLDLPTDLLAAQTWVRQIATAARTARHILTGSEYSRQRIIETLKVHPQKVSSLPWASSPELPPVSNPTTQAQVLGKYGQTVGQPYLFAFGANDPRKNTKRVIEAYQLLPESSRQQARLLIVGLQEPAHSVFRQSVNDSGLAQQVWLNGFVPEEDLPVLLSSALALIYPSTYEGFGLPILDAFACGVPVIAGNKTSLPEVAGDAAILVDPENSDALAGAMFQVLTDARLTDRLRQQGLERAKSYSWNSTAEAVATVFEQIAKRRGVS